MQLESLGVLEEAGIPHDQALAMLQVIDMEIRAAKRALSVDMVATMDAPRTEVRDRMDTPWFGSQAQLSV